MADHLNQPAYARHRRAAGLGGVTRQSVETALADGRIHLEEDGKIDPERADADWEANTDPVRRSSANTKLADARAEKALVDVARARLDLEERQGELVPFKRISREWFDLTRRTRDRLLTVGARLAGEVAAETDARVVERRIDDEIREALSALSENGKGAA